MDDASMDGMEYGTLANFGNCNVPAAEKDPGIVANEEPFGAARLGQVTLLGPSYRSAAAVHRR